MRFPTGSGWSVQALLDQRASPDTSALVLGKVALGVRKLSGKTVAVDGIFRVVGPLVSGFCVDGTGTPRHDFTGSAVGSGPRTSFVVCVTAKFSAEKNRVALYALQLLLDLVVASIGFV